MRGLFSERQGIIKKEMFPKDEVSIEFKNRLWNKIKNYIDGAKNITHYNYFDRNEIIKYLWDSFFKKDIDLLKKQKISPGISFYVNYFIEQIKIDFFNLSYPKLYDFVECLISIGRLDGDKKEFINDLNKIFVDEMIPYKIIDDYVVPIISEEEVKEIESAIDNKYQEVSKHLKRALELYSKRPEADYKNSIKESISAVEALAKKITNKPSAVLSSLTDSLNIHKAFKNGLNNLYNWTSDQGGIRHAEKGDNYLEVNEEDARFMLITCSAFVNYIISKNK